MKKKSKSTSEPFTNCVNAIYTNNMQKLEENTRLMDNIDEVDSDGRSILFYAVIQKDIDALNCVINNGADVNIQDKVGLTVLHYAANSYLVEITKLLLTLGINVDAKDSFGNTALSNAVFNSRGRGEIINLLLEAGADPYEKNNYDVSPIGLAGEIGNYDVEQYFKH